MPTKTTLTSIREALEQVLEGINGENGYYTAPNVLKEIQRATGAGKLPAVKVNTVGYDNDNSTHAASMRVARFNLDAQAASATEIEELCSDIEKALGANRRLGGLCYEVEVEGAQFMASQEEKKVYDASMSVRVQFATMQFEL